MLKLWGVAFFLDMSCRDHGSKHLFLLDAGFLFCQTNLDGGDFVA